MKNCIVRTQDDMDCTIEKYSKTIYKIAFSYTKDKSISEDILQDVLIKYITDSTLFHEEEYRKAWLIRVTINECKKFFRSIWNLRRISLEDVYPFNDPEKHEVFYAVMNLPKKYRMVIHLYYYEELSIKEISSILNIKENTIMSLLYRGRKLLKNIMEVEYEYKPI
jgi:RNA polymerase sigma-70 factor (ECF subfamily)